MKTLREEYPLFRTNRTVHKDDKAKVESQRRMIYDRLQRGPVTGPELNAIAQRFGARLDEIRKAGINIKTTRRKDGIYIYELVRDDEYEQKIY